jgi:hypothetical protein
MSFQTLSLHLEGGDIDALPAIGRSLPCVTIGRRTGAAVFIDAENRDELLGLAAALITTANAMTAEASA